METSKQIQITKDMKLNEIVNIDPSLAEFLTGMGLGCVGCSMSAMETLEQGATFHGMDSEDIEELVEILNKKMENKKPISDPDGITITESAANKIIELSKKSKKNPFLRLAIVDGGCSGSMYSMELAERKIGDFEFKNSEVKVFVDMDSMDFMKGTVIDYVDTLNDSGFKINNPNSKNSCGCGKSSSF